MNEKNKDFLKKPQQIYEEELKSDLKNLMVGLSDEDKMKLAKEIISQLGVNLSSLEQKTDETTTTTTIPEKPENEGWFDSFEGLFIDKIPKKSKIEEKVENNIEAMKPPPTPTKIKEFVYEKPEGWNKKSKKISIFTVIWRGIFDKGMDMKDQRRYDSFKFYFSIVFILFVLFFVLFSLKGSSDRNKETYFDRGINYIIEKYDNLTHKQEKTVVPTTDTVKSVIPVDTIKSIVKIDTAVVKPVVTVTPVVVEPKPVVKDTPVKKPTPVVNKNKKDILVQYIKTLPEYSKFGPLDLPYLTQDANKVDWTFIRADGKSVHFHYNTIEGTFGIVE